MMIEEWNDTPWRYAPRTQDHDSKWVELIPNFQRSIYISCKISIKAYMYILSRPQDFQNITRFGLGRLEK